MARAAFFGTDALVILTGSAEVARDYHWPFALLAFAYGLNGFALIPNALRLSEGQPGTALWSNVAAAAVYLPAIVLLTPSYGVMAPAALWLAANAFIVLVLVVRAHRDGIAGYAWGWAWNCVIPQFAVTGAVYNIAKAALPQASSPLAGRGCGGDRGGLGLPRLDRGQRRVCVIR